MEILEADFSCTAQKMNWAMGRVFEYCDKIQYFPQKQSARLKNLLALSSK